MDHKLLIEQAPLPIMVIQQGRISYANSAFLDLLAWAGYDAAPDQVFGSDLFRLVAPEERDASRSNIERLMRDKAPVQLNITRTLVNAQGERYTALISTSQITWNSRSALTASFVLLGPKEPNVTDINSPGQQARDHRRQVLERLTPKERQIAQLVASGYTTANICAHLEIQESTARSHIKAIFRKTGTHSRAELTRLIIGFRPR